MRRNGVSSITYGALFTALVGVLVYINRLTANFIDVYFFWIIPIIVIVYRCKFDLRDTLMTCFAMLLLTVILAGPISTSAFYVLASVIAGVIYGQGLMKGKNGLFLIGSVIAVSLVVMFLSTFVFASFFGHDLTEELSFLQEMVQMYAQQVSKANPEVGKTILSVFGDNMLMSFIIIGSILSSVLEGILVHLLAYIALKRLKIATLPPMKPISEIYCPMWLKVVVFAILFASIAAKFTGVDSYNNIIQPLEMIALAVCYFFGYICIATFMAIRRGKKKNNFALSLLIGIFCILFSTVVVGLGIFDIFSGFRKRVIEEIKKNVEQQNHQA